MTDKQIVIDGVDVSGCVRLQDDNISCELGGKCQGWDNCYYKQLKRAEHKLEKIKDYCEEHYKPMEYWQEYKPDKRTEKYIVECARHNLAHDILQIIKE